MFCYLWENYQNELKIDNLAVIEKKWMKLYTIKSSETDINIKFYLFV